jgi:serine/threonine-protein kinase
VRHEIAYEIGGTPTAPMARMTSPIGVAAMGTGPTLEARRTSLLWGTPIGGRRTRPPSLVGRTLDGRYEITRVLGEGGMGVAYEARDRLLDRGVVVKVVAPSSSDPSASDRLMREARLACRVVHDAIVTVHHLGMLETREPFLVMERLSGRDLGSIATEQGALSIGVVAALLEPIAGALAALHAHGVVHRDVKPDNVFVLDGDLRRARAKLIDFGLAVVDADTAARLTETGHLLGTAEYMAPECARGAAATPASDAYALAVTAFELLAGHLPHEGSGIEVLLAKTTTAPRRLSELRNDRWVAQADALFARALAMDPAERPSVLELAAALRAIADRTNERAREETQPAIAVAVRSERVPATSSGSIAWISFVASMLALASSVLALAR